MSLYQILYENEILFRMEEPAGSVTTGKPQEPDADRGQVAARPATTAPQQRVSSAPVTPEVPFPEIKHPLLILTDVAERPDLSASETTLLTNILKAVGRSKEMSDVINYSYLQNKDARLVLSGHQVSHLISFGVPLIRLQIDVVLTPYIPKFIDGVWFLLADPLPAIESNKENKRKLWEALQRIFL